MRANNKTSGMGLIGLLIAVGIGSVVSLAVLNLIQQTHEQQKRAVLKNELTYLKTRFAEILRQDRTFLNTLNSTLNTNMSCLRNRTPCAVTRVASAYAPTQDRIAVLDGSPAPGQIFYDGRSSSTQGFTTKGALCTGFSATGGGNDNCPVGFIVTWYVNAPSSTEGLALTISAKMVFNPSDTHPLKNFFNATSSSTTLGAYDIAVTKTVASLTDLSVISCTVGPVQIHHMGSNTFYQTSSVPTGSRCNSEVRVCTITNDVANLSGSYTHSSCVQNCSGSWGSCSAPCGGGMQTFTHQIPANQWGAACAFADGAVRSCNTAACPVNCVGSWGACAGGSQTYTITTPASGGGTACPFSSGATQSCGVNCVGGWSACSGGTRTYTVTTPASGGGATCPVANGTTQSCGVNCVGSWGGCSSGSQTYTITTPASGGGTACPHTNGQTQSCGTNCVGSWSTCAGGSQSYSITTPASGGGSSCPFTNGAIRSCGTNCVGSWGSYGSCSASCGGGTQTRTYTVTTPASGGGSACPYSNGQTQSQSCNTNPCGPVNCVGSWSVCSAGVTTTTFTITTPASGGGAACSAPHGTTTNCNCFCACGSWSCGSPYYGNGMAPWATTKAQCLAVSGVYHPASGCTPNGCGWYGGPGPCQ